VESLRALAHPLRVQIIDVLSLYGSFTASGLAERLGESSGATSYHLRQLEKHGFVREVVDMGTGRERWWERVPGGISVASRETDETPAGKAASRVILRQWKVNRENLLDEFMDRGYDELPPRWTESSAISTMNTRLTSDQLHSLVEEVTTLIDSYLNRYRGSTEPGSRPIHIDFMAFPVIDGEEVPGWTEPEQAAP
jgi:DNA-binding transcriptional ArsR family regulator